MTTNETITTNYKPDPNYLLEVRNLKQFFPITTGFLKTTMLKAVDDVSFAIRKGETLGLVGESGCGKTTVGRSLLHLYKPTSGEVWFDGELIEPGEKMTAFRRRAQIVFQDPYSSLNPRMTVGDIIAEPIDVHKLCANNKERYDRVNQLLGVVGLSSEQSTRYAHEFSGGQRQRIGIARALASDPELIVCDEPVSALDVSIQAQVINMLEDLQSKFGLTYLFIAHDLSVVKHISDRIAVMYLGKLVELASSVELHRRPLHPYTISLLSAVPIPDPVRARKAQRIVIDGDIPSPLNAPSGCAFRTRCPRATEKCAECRPEFVEVEPEHFVACHNL
ncbi:MAG: ATP-binding cassette domain-containing protein [Oscillospiraceae bacterium]